MNQRRDFLKLASTAIIGSNVLGSNSLVASANAPYKFKMNYGPHLGMFEASAGKDIVAQLQFMADQGFTALEDNEMLSRPVGDQKKIGDTLAKLGMTMGVFVIEGGDNWKTSLATGKQEFVDRFVQACKDSVEVAKRCGAKWMTVVPGYFERNLPIGIQTGHVIEALRKGAAVLEPHGLIMVLEPLSDNPDLFLRTSDQGYMICKAVNSPSCKLLFDIYHMQRNEGHIIPHIDWAWSEIAYVQIGDNPGRNEPTTGEINYQNIFKHLYKKGYKGVLGMEHGNYYPGKEGNQKLIDAYKFSDSFSI